MKSYHYVRDHDSPVVATDFVRHADEITVDYEPGRSEDIRMPNGSMLRLRKMSDEYNPHDRAAAIGYVQSHQEQGEVVTGLLYFDPNVLDLHGVLDTIKRPLNSLTEADLCPGWEVLEEINQSLR